MHRSIASALVLLVLMVTPSVAAAPVVKHSGAVVSVDLASGRLVLEEVGPWVVENGRTVTHRYAIRVTPDTQFILAKRDATDWTPPAFVTRPLTRPLAAGDYVTVECRHEAKRLVAISITVVAPETP